MFSRSSPHEDDDQVYDEVVGTERGALSLYTETYRSGSPLMVVSMMDKSCAGSVKRILQTAT